ncbi:phage portal protein [Domibacillus aminovorans]|uniref:Portal protein n=1 Tax=Domibacillus aminovorans TaxID=29332 RepID=A0A177L5V4_9BACI|nr:phage portal protein [Domibacillus aminovorans]OAH60746.1 portal protein [Domibacillus aminovorans]
MKKEKRSIWDKLFGVEPAPIKNETQFQLMNGFIPSFHAFGNDPYASDIVRGAIHAISSNTAKLKPKHIRRKDGEIEHVSGHIERLLTLRPNQFMSAYDFIYKIVTQLYLHNNAFVYINYGSDGRIEGFYPVDASSMELVESGSVLYVKFQFANGKKLASEYENFIHLRRFFAKSDMFGENNEAMLPTLELIKTTDEGIVNAVKSSAFLRGLLKFQAMLKGEDLKKNRDSFVQDYLDVTNNGGIAAIDSKADYIELKNDPKMVDSKQMEAIELKVYKYFGINKEIVTSSYTEDQWNAFYESVIEPIAIQLSLEFSHKLFTDREQGFGNEIIFEANRLQYASNVTKINMVRDLMPLGILSKNEAREIFNLSSIEGGDEFVQTLNVVNAAKADQYQNVNKGSDPPKGGETNDEEVDGDGD